MGKSSPIVHPLNGTLWMEHNIKVCKKYINGYQLGSRIKSMKRNLHCPVIELNESFKTIDNAEQIKYTVA